MRALRRALDIGVGAVCCGRLAAMIAVLAWQVFSRYALNAPSTFSEEALRFGVIWVSLLGAAYSTGRGTHMAVDLLREMTRGGVRRALEFLVPLAFLVFSLAVLVRGGLHGVEIAARQTSPVLQIPMGYIYASLPVSGALMALYSVLNLVDLVRDRRRLPDDLERMIIAGD